jgi:hypothetical protein
MRSWITCLVGVVLSLAVARTSHAQGTTAPSSAPVEPPPRVKLAEMLHVELRDRGLAMSMTPPAGIDAELNAARSVSVDVAESDDSGWRILCGLNERGADGRYQRFAVEIPDLPYDRWSPLRLTRVVADQEGVIVSGAGRMTGRNWVTVTFHQETLVKSARLTVNRNPRAGVPRPLHDYTGPDLVTLWNEHQREVRLYLLPLLRTFAPNENLLRPRAGDVYRVFGDIPADTEMMKKVAALLPDLEADTPAAREAASKRIEALGSPAILALLRMDRGEWTPEQTARLSEIVQRASTLIDPTAWRRDIYFLTDCLDDPDPLVRHAALDAARAVAGREVEFDVDAAPEARLAASQEVLRTLEAATGR